MCPYISTGHGAATKWRSITRFSIPPYILYACASTKTAEHLEVSTFGATELLKIEIEHGSHPNGHLRSQEGLLDVLGKVMEGGHCLCGQGEVGATLTLIF